MEANIVIKGRAWKYGDDVNTDVIFPGKYTYTVSDPAEMPQYALEDLDPNFAEQVQPFDRRHERTRDDPVSSVLRTRRNEARRSADSIHRSGNR